MWDHRVHPISPGWWGWGGSRPPPFSLLPSRTSCSVRSCWEGRYTPSISSLPYMYSVGGTSGQFFQISFHSLNPDSGFLVNPGPSVWCPQKTEMMTPREHPSFQNMKYQLIMWWGAQILCFLSACGTLTIFQCCGTVTIYYGSGSVSGSDFWKVLVPVPVPTFEKLWFRFQLLKKLRFRFRFQLHI